MLQCHRNVSSWWSFQFHSGNLLIKTANQFFSAKFSITSFQTFKDDLDEDDVMLLDTWNQLFIWVGANANKIEKEKTAVAAVNKINFNSISWNNNLLVRVPSNWPCWPRCWHQYYNSKTRPRTSNIYRWIYA